MASTPGVKCDPVSGQTGFIQQVKISDCIAHRILAANVAQSIAVPSGSKWVQLIPANDTFANLVATAVVPVASVDGSVVIPVGAGTGRLIGPLDGVTSISVISAIGGIVSGEFLA